MYSAPLSEHPKEVKIETLIKELVPKTNQWEIIGQYLGITDVQLKRIDKENSDEKSRFREVLNTWKRLGKKPFTWNTIIEVLREDAIQETMLADDLYQKYCS